MENSLPNTDATELLSMIRPWFDAEQSYIVDLAKQDIAARLMVAITLMESAQPEPAGQLLKSIIDTPDTEDIEHEKVRLRALIEIAQLEMEQLSYDIAESYLWQARNRYTVEISNGIDKEDISLFIAQCRFGQGFVQDAIDRAEEIVRKLQKVNASTISLTKVFQQLGWYYIHKSNVPQALEYMRKAMEMAPRLDQRNVDAGMAAEREGQFEKALEHYFDAIHYNE